MNPAIKDRPGPIRPAGEGKGAWLAALEQGSNLLQETPPDLLQCVLFDGNTRQANLIGIEYIVSEKLFETLPEDEKDYWHPHHFEVLSGQLVAPGLPDVAEKAFMKRLMNSYGKTWHTWHTGRHDEGGGHDLPLGDPKLMWSFNREGECDERLKQDRNRVMGLDTQKTRAERQDLVALAHPQRDGVSADSTPWRAA